jgi:hypothetical protein
LIGFMASTAPSRTFASSRGRVGGGEHCGERDAPSVRHNVALRARFATMRRIRPGFSTPLFAGTLAESSEALSHSIRLASPRRSRSAGCNSFHNTLPSCQARKRRQHVEPEPQPICFGSISQGMALFTLQEENDAGQGGPGGHPGTSSPGLGRLLLYDADSIRRWIRKVDALEKKRASGTKLDARRSPSRMRPSTKTQKKLGRGPSGIHTPTTRRRIKPPPPGRVTTNQLGPSASFKATLKATLVAGIIRRGREGHRRIRRPLSPSLACASIVSDYLRHPQERGLRRNDPLLPGPICAPC